MSSKTAQSVKEKLARELSEINKDPDVQKQLIRQGLVPETKVLGEFDQYIAKEITKFGKIIKSDSKS
ncbi:Tripartite tricarboxylate transporter family receptor [compost metagenome]